MTLINHTFQILAVALLTAPIGAYAESWSCSHDNDVREVHIERTTSSPAPCKVVYKKLTEGAEDQVLWNAENDGAYCDDKAAAFVAKLESWGWVCAETISDKAPADTAADTMPDEAPADTATDTMPEEAPADTAPQ